MRLIIFLAIIHFLAPIDQKESVETFIPLSVIHATSFKIYDARLANSVKFQIDDEGVIYLESKKVFNSSLFDNDYSFLIDYFNSAKTSDSYLLITPVKRNVMSGSSSFSIISRQEVLIIDLYSRRSYHTSFPEGIHFFSSEMFETLPQGSRISDISTKTSEIYIESKDPYNLVAYDLHPQKKLKKHIDCVW